MRLTFLFTVLFLFCLNAAAQLPGSLDASFGTNGIEVTTASAHQLRVVALQSSGKIVAAGFIHAGGQADLLLVRYNADGSPDLTFGSGGTVTTNINGNDAIEAGLVIQPDDKIVVAGYCSNSNGNMQPMITRYTANGALDNTFGVGGIRIITSLTGELRGLALQPDGKIVGAGYRFLPNNSAQAILVRLDSSGNPDPSFDTDGIVFTALDTQESLFYSVLVQPDGKIVGGGSGKGTTGNYRFAIARYTANGTLDGGFGTAGITLTAFGSGDASADEVLLQNDGKLVLVGGTSTNLAALARYTSSGMLDTGFGTGGMVLTSVQQFTVPFDAALTSDDRIVVTNQVYDGSVLQFNVNRYLPDGDLDPSFGNNGIVLTPVGTNDISYGVALQPDEKIIVVGVDNSAPVSGHYVAVRYHGGCPPVDTTLVAEAVNNYTLNGQTYTVSGTYTQTLAAANTCDSIVTLILTITGGTTSVLDTAACGSYTLNGQTYTASGTYTQVIPNAAGFDSTITLNLEILAETTSQLTHFSCESTYTLNGQVYIASGTYTQVLTNAQGCDSTITLNLTLIELDNGTSADGNVLSANLSGAVYQWIDCATVQFIAGQTQQQFAPSVNGSYAVIVSQNGCIDTSACVAVTTIGMAELFGGSVNVSPNPTTGKVEIRFPSPAAANIGVYDVRGKLVSTVVSEGSSISLEIPGGPGFYLLALEMATGKQIVCVVKE